MRRLLLAASLISCVPVDGTDCLATASAAITAGSQHALLLLASPREEAAVVAITFRFASPPATNTCSGVLVAPRWVLTARHCTLDRQPEQMEVATGVDAAGLGQLVAGIGVVGHPVLDLLLVELAEPSLAAPSRPSPIVPAPGSVAQIAGFGRSARAGLRQFAAVTVMMVSSPFAIVSGGGATGACAGDSGGPLLMRTSGGAIGAVGVLSHGSADCAGTDSYTLVAGAEDWLSERIGAAPDEQHADCGALTSIGRCFGATAVWCQAGRRRGAECSSCGWDPTALGYRCVDPDHDPCGGISDVGVCDEGVATRCVDGRLAADSCGVCGVGCQRMPLDGRAVCAGGAR